MARTLAFTSNKEVPLSGIIARSRAFVVERVTRIELALSAWESVAAPQSARLSCTSGSPRVTAVAHRSPGLMAR